MQCDIAKECPITNQLNRCLLSETIETILAVFTGLRGTTATVEDEELEGNDLNDPPPDLTLALCPVTADPTTDRPVPGFLVLDSRLAHSFIDSESA